MFNGRTILDFNETRDDEVAVASAGPYAIHLHLAPNRKQTAKIYPQVQHTEGSYHIYVSQID